MAKIFRPERINLYNHPEINEKVIQEIIAEDPSIIGLGDLVLKDKERIQPKAGRLDLLMQDPDSNRRYEIEIQLGKTDESHIIRTIGIVQHNIAADTHSILPRQLGTRNSQKGLLR